MDMAKNVSTIPANAVFKDQLLDSIQRLSGWLDKNDYSAYDTFDGLNARFLRPLTFETKFLRQVLQQGVRRFPINVRPLLGISKSRSSKGMGFIAKGFLRMHEATGDTTWRRKAESALQWLIDNHVQGLSGACWGNHFDYQSRSFYMPKDTPTIVWTSLIGHAFLDAYDLYKTDRYLQVAVSACEHIVHDIERFVEGDAVCIGYVPIPGTNKLVHNSSTLGGSLLARTFALTQIKTYRALAEQAMRYTANHQLADSSWYYGEAQNLHWVDNFHTAYVLDCFKYYSEGTGDYQFQSKLLNGYEYWKKTFFLLDGTPRYYNTKTLPLDIQCCSQAIDTLVFFSNLDNDSLPLAVRVAQWTIDNMQDSSGYFYYRRYSKSVVNKTPTLHWGQATMLSALAGLYKNA